MAHAKRQEWREIGKCDGAREMLVVVLHDTETMVIRTYLGDTV